MAHPTGVIGAGLRCRIVGCSYCVNVPPAAWWDAELVWWVPALALVGLVAALWGRGRRDVRTPALLIAGAFLVLVPSAGIAAYAGHRDLRLDIADAGFAPIDDDHWRVRCEGPFLGPRDGNELGHAAWDACHRATAPHRYAAVGLAGAGVAMAAVGFVLVLLRGRGTDDDRRSRQSTPT